MANELVGLDAWLETALRADSTFQAIVKGRIYEGAAPNKDLLTGDPPLYPLCTFAVVSCPDVNSAANRVMTLPLVRIVVIGEGSGYAAIQSPADRIDAVMDGVVPVNVTIGGKTFSILGCVRERGIQRSWYENGVRYNSLGGEYRVWIQ